MKRVSAAAIVLVLLGGIAGCGGGGRSNSAGTFDVTGLCSDAPRAQLGLDESWKVCADNGFMPTNDSFSFENYGGPVSTDAITVATAIALFGDTAVCSSGSGPTCKPSPSALQWIESSNAQLEGGRCEGMAVESQRISEGREAAASLQRGATHVADLRLEQPTVGASISRWWATQTFPEVQLAAADSRRSDPVTIAGEVASALRNKDGVTLGIYWSEGGHSLTPVAVSWNGDDTIRLSVYDSNHPGEIRALDIDRRSSTWTYADAQLNSATPSGTVEGGKGTLEYTLMKVREQARTAPWMVSSAKGGSKGATSIAFSTRGRAPIDVSITDGTETFLASSLLSTPREGFDYRPTIGARGQFGTGGSLSIDPSRGDVKVRSVIGQPFAPSATVPLVLSVNQPGPGSLLVRAELGTGDDVQVAIESDDDEQSVAIDPDGTGAEIEYAAGDDRYDFTIDENSTFAFDDPVAGGFSMSVLDVNGRRIWSDDFDTDFGDAGAIARAFIFDAEGLQRVLDSAPSWDVMDEAAWDAFSAELDAWFDDFESRLDQFLADVPTVDDVPTTEPTSMDEPSADASPGPDEPNGDEPSTSVDSSTTTPEIDDSAPPTTSSSPESRSTPPETAPEDE